MGWEYSEISLHVYIMVAMGTAFSVIFFLQHDTLHSTTNSTGVKGQTLTTTLRFTVCVCAEGSVCVCGGGGEEREEGGGERSGRV